MTGKFLALIAIVAMLGGSMRAAIAQDHGIRNAPPGYQHLRNGHLPQPSGNSGGHHHSAGHFHFGSGFRPGYSYYPDYGYPAFGYVPGPGFYDPYYYYYLPPVYLPAETIYGPQAVRRFFGMDALNRAQPDLILKNRKQAEDADVDEPLPPAGVGQAAELAWRFVGLGDANFGEQRYHEALQRYKKASELAPRLAEPYFRQGHALMALAKYDAAAKAYKRGLKLDPTWARSNFRLSEIYGDNRAAQTAHRDALAAAAQDQLDADLLFVLGVQLHFDGQKERAVNFFQRAAELAGDADHLAGFLAEQEPPPAPRGAEF